LSARFASDNGLVIARSANSFADDDFGSRSDLMIFWSRIRHPHPLSGAYVLDSTAAVVKRHKPDTGHPAGRVAKPIADFNAALR
jgi:hypothetical protein